MLGPLLLIITLVIIISAISAGKSNDSATRINNAVQLLYQDILNIALKEAIIKTYYHLDIEEGGHYPRFFRDKDILIVKSTLKDYLNRHSYLIKNETSFNISESKYKPMILQCLHNLKNASSEQFD